LTRFTHVVAAEPPSKRDGSNSVPCEVTMRISPENLWALRPSLADELMRREALESLEAFGEIVNSVVAQHAFFALTTRLMMKDFCTSTINKLHPSDLILAPRIVGASHAVPDSVAGTDRIEAWRARALCWVQAPSRRLRKWLAVVRDNGMDFVGQNFHHPQKKFRSRFPVGSLIHLSMGELRYQVYRKEEAQIAFSASYLSNVQSQAAY
jgi:hypothetical protein